MKTNNIFFRSPGTQKVLPWLQELFWESGPEHAWGKEGLVPAEETAMRVPGLLKMVLVLQGQFLWWKSRVCIYIMK